MFQIDGNFGATAAMAEMLLQADEYRVLLLPALPSEWAEGSVQGLVVPGGAVVGLAWTDGGLSDCRIMVGKPYQGVFCYRGVSRRVSLHAGGETHLTAEYFNCMERGE